jgi:hypothetical protein
MSRNRTTAAGPLAPPLAVPLVIDSPAAARSAQPVTVGLPFPRGELTWPTVLTLADTSGDSVPVQAEPLARWSDGSVRWLLVDFVARGLQSGANHYQLSAATGGVPFPVGPLCTVSENAGSLEMATGRVVFRLDQVGGGLPQITLAGRPVLTPAGTGIVLTDPKGRIHRPRIERMAIEANGPVRATVRLEGKFSGAAPCRFVARLDAFAGTGLLRARLTLHNPRRARHGGGLWDLGDPGSILFRGLSLEWAVADSTGCRAEWRAEPEGSAGSDESGPVEVYQDSSGGENWNSRNHLNREGRVACAFRGYRVRAATRELHGLRANPILSVQSPTAAVTVAVPEFWQQFPKSVAWASPSLRVGLFPEQFGDLHELQGGEQKTHTVWLEVKPARSSEPSHGLDWVYQPAVAHAMPDWYAKSGAFPHMMALNRERPSQLDEYLGAAVEGEQSLFAGREVIDEYGWRSYGEIYADHEAGPCYALPPSGGGLGWGEEESATDLSTPHPNPPPQGGREQERNPPPQGGRESPTRPPLISHYNNQYDVAYGAILQFCRTGDRRWWEIADPLARHVADIDVYHTVEDKAAYNGGLFWFTDHYKDAATATHRTYSRVNRRRGQPYGGGPGSSHNFPTGLAHHYYLTGDPVSRDAALSLADWVIAMDDGARNILGWIDNGPTGLASSTFDPNYHGPGRGAGLSINALMDGLLLSGRRSYLEKAEELIRRCVHPADDVDARELLDVEKRWSYTIFLVVLDRYLAVKAEAGELDDRYAYARDSLLRYAEWMAEHEVPYFDRAEQLEYPTETWAAQEFRKANVLRLAAAYADGPLRERLLARGRELADRAWHDLLRFPSRHVARAVAIMLTEGTRDDAFRHQGPGVAPRPAGAWRFADPVRFTGQKRRVLARLRGRQPQSDRQPPSEPKGSVGDQQ